jgi:predicted phosphohydrolase
MIQEFKKEYDEVLIENNLPSEMKKISLPEDWWSTHNSYEIFLNKNMKLVKLNTAKVRSISEISFQGWDIKKGDFNQESENQKKIFTREDKDKIKFASFIGFLVVVIGIVILISYGIAETIRW